MNDFIECSLETWAAEIQDDALAISLMAASLPKITDISKRTCVLEELKWKINGLNGLVRATVNSNVREMVR